MERIDIKLVDFALSKGWYIPNLAQAKFGEPLTFKKRNIHVWLTSAAGIAPKWTVAQFVMNTYRGHEFYNYNDLKKLLKNY